MHSLVARWLVMGGAALVVILLVIGAAMMLSRPSLSEVVAQETQRAVPIQTEFQRATDNATRLMPVSTAVPSPVSTPTAIPDTTDGYRVMWLRHDADGQLSPVTEAVLADGITRLTVRVETLSAAFEGRSLNLTVSGGGTLHNTGALTLPALSDGPLDVAYVIDNVAGTKRVDAQVILPDRIEVRSATITAFTEVLALDGRLYDNAGGTPSVRLSLRRVDGQPVQGQYTLRVLTAEGVAVLTTERDLDSAASAQVDVRISAGEAEVFIRRLSNSPLDALGAPIDIPIEAFVIEREQALRWRDTLYGLPTRRITFVEIEGATLGNVPENTQRYRWSIAAPERRWCVRLEGSNRPPPVIVFEVHPILVVTDSPALGLTLEGLPIEPNQPVRTDERRFAGTSFRADYRVCARVGFGVPGLYRLVARLNHADVSAQVGAVVYLDDWTSDMTYQRVAGRWVGLFDELAQLLPAVQMTEASGAQIFLLAPFVGTEPSWALVSFWAQLDSQALEDGFIRPLDGAQLRWIGRIFSYIDLQNPAQYRTDRLYSTPTSGLGSAHVLRGQDGASFEYRTASGEVWTRVYAIALVADAPFEQGMTPLLLGQTYDFAR
jgi:hypothetical protein